MRGIATLGVTVSGADVWQAVGPCSTGGEPNAGRHGSSALGGGAVRGAADLQQWQHERRTIDDCGHKRGERRGDGRAVGRRDGVANEFEAADVARVAHAYGRQSAIGGRWAGPCVMEERTSPAFRIKGVSSLWI